MKGAYLSMLTADDCLTFGETAFTLFRYEVCAQAPLNLLAAPTVKQRWFTVTLTYDVIISSENRLSLGGTVNEYEEHYYYQRANIANIGSALLRSTACIIYFFCLCLIIFQAGPRAEAEDSRKILTNGEVCHQESPSLPFGEPHSSSCSSTGQYYYQCWITLLAVWQDFYCSVLHCYFELWDQKYLEN